MASSDIVSLFTNIPVSENKQIIITKIVSTSTALYGGFVRKKFMSLLEIFAEDNVFVFSVKFNKQIDDVSIGGFVSPTLAEIFFSFHEQNWIDQCATEFKPVFYRTYVDVTLGQ